MKLTIEIIESLSPDPTDPEVITRGYATRTIITTEDPAAEPHDETTLPMFNAMFVTAMRTIMSAIMGAPVTSEVHFIGPNDDPNPGQTIEEMISDYQARKVAQLQTDTDFEWELPEIG